MEYQVYKIFCMFACLPSAQETEHEDPKFDISLYYTVSPRYSDMNGNTLSRLRNETNKKVVGYLYTVWKYIAVICVIKMANS